MTTACDLAAEEMGSGVAGALTAVDCIASEVSEQAFERLFGADGQLGVALMIVLTLYVAFFGISLLLGRSNLSVRALIPKMVTLGLVLTFATSFAAFSTIFYNVFVATPDYLAGVLTDSDGSATATFALKLDIVFLAVQEASTGISDISAFSPPGMMWIGAMLLLIGTVGLLVTARIGLALLLAVGPIFVVLALFNGTRGLFVGWLKGLGDARTCAFVCGGRRLDHARDGRADPLRSGLHSWRDRPTSGDGVFPRRLCPLHADVDGPLCRLQNGERLAGVWLCNP